MTNSIAKMRVEKLTAHENRTTKRSGRLQVYVGADVEDLIAKLAIVLGCKRAEVVQLSVKEFAAGVHPDLLIPPVPEDDG